MMTYIAAFLPRRIRAAAMGRVSISKSRIFAALTIGAGLISSAHAQSSGALSNYYLDRHRPRIEVPVVLNKAETVRIDLPFGDALVGNPEIADIVPLTNQSVYILGKKVGVTRLSLLDSKKAVLGVIDIEVTYDLDIIRRQLRENPGFAHLKVHSINGKVLVTGVAEDAAAMQQVINVAEQIAPHDVTNGMKVASPQQVMLEVRFIEASRTANFGFGVEWAAAGKLGAITNNGAVSSGSITGAGGGNFANTSIFNTGSGALPLNLTPFGTFAGQVVGGSVRADLAVNALEERGLARTLAEPNLLALSGDTASFLAGGEFPFPTGVNAFNQVSVEFKKFGIGLAFTPTVLSGGQVNLKVEPEVSELDSTQGVTIAGYVIPGLKVRRASTTVELRDGQSFMIAGLLSGEHKADTQGLPWFGDVPVVGTLFRSQSYQKNETDLVILITPRLVRPKIPGDKAATPLDNRKPTTSEEFTLLGKQEVEVSPPKYAGGHILDYPSANPWQPQFSPMK